MRVASIVPSLQIESRTLSGFGGQHVREAIECGAAALRREAAAVVGRVWALSLRYGTEVQLDALFEDLLRSIRTGEQKNGDCHAASPRKWLAARPATTGSGIGIPVRNLHWTRLS